MKVTRLSMAALALSAALLFPAVSGAATQAEKICHVLADANAYLDGQPTQVVEGRILRVIEVTFSGSRNDYPAAVVVDLLGDQGEVIAYMGPKRFLENRDYGFKAGERVEVGGSFVNVNGTMMLIASSFKAAEGASVALRDERGTLLSSK